MHLLLYQLLLLSTVGICGDPFGLKYYVVEHNDISESNSLANDSVVSRYSLAADNTYYNCFIPVKKGERQEDIGESETELENMKTDAINVIREFNRDSRPIRTLKEGGYWNYLIRYDHDILQFHFYHDDTNRVDIFKLAAWSDNDDRSSFNSTPYYLADPQRDPYGVSSDFEMVTMHDGTRFVSQKIGNGEICDLTGLPRYTTINYFCNDKLDRPLLRSIREWKTCEYLIDLESQEFCKHPMWTLPKSLMSNRIDCYPVKEHEDEIFERSLALENMSLIPFTEGIYFVFDISSPKFVLTLTQNYHLWTGEDSETLEKFQKLLIDISVGLEKFLRNRKFENTNEQIKNAFLASDRMDIIFEIYDIDQSYIGNVRLTKDADIVLYFTDESVPDDTNFL